MYHIDKYNYKVYDKNKAYCFISQCMTLSEFLPHFNVFADIFNYFLYEGEQRIRPELLMSVDTAEIVIPYGEEENDVPAQKFRDKMKILSAKKDMSAVYLILGQ